MVRLGTVGLFFLAALILVSAPASAYGWKSLIFHLQEDCVVDCNQRYESLGSSSPANAIIVVAALMTGMFLFYSMGRLRKFETVSMRCSSCGRSTHGLKCPFCSAG